MTDRNLLAPELSPAQPYIALRRALPLALLIATLTLLLHFGLTLWSLHAGYGYFRDEFYYVMCGRRLDWGYVDHGPLVAVQARLSEFLFGDSVFGLRILSALAGALVIGLTGLLTAAFGGGRRAQVLAMLSLLVAGVYLALDSFLSMNSWEPVFWTLLVLGLRLLWLGASARPVWLGIGVTVGLGLLNKPSLLFFLGCLFAGLLLTPERRLLWSRWAGVATILATAIAFPFLHWQITHNMAMLEFLHHGEEVGKNIVLTPWPFFVAQLTQMNPLTAPVWIAGVINLLRGQTVPGGRAFGIAALLFFPLMYSMHAKDYYLAPIYPMLFAAGARALVAWICARPQLARAGLWAYEGLLGITGIVFLPVAVPVLKPTTFLAYAEALHLPKPNTEVMKSGPLPQFFADRFGWQQELAMVKGAVATLTPEQRSRAAILTENYGEAAALEFLGHDLPPVVSGHNNYYLWGPHDRHTGPFIVIKADPLSHYQQICRSVQVVGTLSDPWMMQYEHKTIYLVDGCSVDLTRDWAKEKNYI